MIRAQPAAPRTFRLGSRFYWLSASALICSVAAVFPLLDLFVRQWTIPSWALDIALMFALVVIGRLVSELTVLRSAATVDVLTGTMARRALESDLARLVNGNRPFGLIFVDVNGMKQVNDSYGHDAGDALLCYVADRLRHHVRPTDLVYRFGGDEFVVLLPGSDQALTLSVCQRLNTHMDEIVTAGAAAYPENGETPQAVLKAADSAMYQERRERRSVQNSNQ